MNFPMTFCFLFLGWLDQFWEKKKGKLNIDVCFYVSLLRVTIDLRVLLTQQEFEIIAQIKLLQEAAKNYIIVQDEKFRRWFDNIKTFTESERLVYVVNRC